MIEYNYEFDFVLDNEVEYTHWLTRVIKSEERIIGDINYIFCSDNYLHSLNQKYLNHDSLTDIITFDYSEDTIISGDIFISIDRIKDNSRELKEDFVSELNRVMVHGLLHMMGYNDKTALERAGMRKLEKEKMLMFHVEQ